MKEVGGFFYKGFYSVFVNWKKVGI